MNKFMISLVASALFILPISSGSEHTVSAASNSVDTSVYYSPPTAHKEDTTNAMVWKEGSVTVTASKHKLEGPITSSISAIKVKVGTQSFALEPQDASHADPKNIQSISLSPTKKYLAIQLEYSNGYNLMVLDLHTGKYKILNDIVKSVTYVESTPVYSWSPDGKKLAFAYGDPSISRIAVYNLSYDTFTYVPRVTSTISTAIILWDKTGKYLDYASEYPSDQYVLYRYSFDTKKVKAITKMNRQQLTNLTKR